MDMMIVFFTVFLIVYLLFLTAVLAFSVICYIFGSLGLQGVAKGLGMKAPWLVWIPYASSWAMGKIADEATARVYGQKSNFAKWMLIATIATGSSAFLVLPLIFVIEVALITGTFGEGILLFLYLLYFLLYLVILGFSIAYTVLLYICYWRMFKLCCPDKAVLFLLLGIFVTYPMPFFTYYCRDKVPPLESEENVEAFDDAVTF